MARIEPWVLKAKVAEFLVQSGSASSSARRIRLWEVKKWMFKSQRPGTRALALVHYLTSAIAYHYHIIYSGSCEFSTARLLSSHVAQRMLVSKTAHQAFLDHCIVNQPIAYLNGNSI